MLIYLDSWKEGCTDADLALGWDVKEGWFCLSRSRPSQRQPGGCPRDLRSTFREVLVTAWCRQWAQPQKHLLKKRGGAEGKRVAVDWLAGWLTLRRLHRATERAVWTGAALVCPSPAWQPLAHHCSDGKASAYNAGDPGSIPGSGRAPGEGNGNPLQYSCLESPMDWGAWWAAVHGVAKSRTQLSDFTFTFPSLRLRVPFWLWEGCQNAQKCMWLPVMCACECAHTTRAGTDLANSPHTFSQDPLGILRKVKEGGRVGAGKGLRGSVGGDVSLGPLPPPRPFKSQWMTQDFLVVPWLRLPSNAGSEGFIPGQGAKILHAQWPKKQNMKQKYCNRFNKDFEILRKNLKKKKKSMTQRVFSVWWLNILSFVWISIWIWWGYGNHFCNCFTTLFWEIVLVWGSTWKKKLELKSGEKLSSLRTAGSSLW